MTALVAPDFRPTPKNQLTTVRATEALAETSDERHAAQLWRAWAYWHRRWTATPTPALDRREAASWAALCTHVIETGLAGTAFDPRD